MRRDATLKPLIVHMINANDTQVGLTKKFSV